MPTGSRATWNQLALAHASSRLVPEHFIEVKTRRETTVDKTLTAIHERLVKEINYWSDRYIKLQDDMAAGKDVRLNLENVRRTIDELTARLESRSKELKAMRHVISATPVVLGGALVIPAGLLAQRKGEQEGESWTADADARARVERIAMEAVMDAEHRLGHSTFDVSAEKCGWDITSIPPAVDGQHAASRDTSRSRVAPRGNRRSPSHATKSFTGSTRPTNSSLAIVLVDGDQHEGPFYVRNPFKQEPDWGVASMNWTSISCWRWQRSHEQDGCLQQPGR